MTKPPIGPTEPLAGVMEAKPAIQPVTAPTKEDFPNLIFSISQVPYTISGKKVEIAVKKIINGEKVKNKDLNVYNLLTNSEYKFPTNLPNGKYRIP